MKQINPLAIHSESLYRMSDIQSQAAMDKQALEMKRNYLETRAQFKGQRGWWGLLRFGKLAQFRGHDKAV